MAGISTLGVGSGLDINGIIANLISSERQQRILPLQQREAKLSSRISIYGQIRSAFADFEDKTKAMNSAAKAYRDFTGTLPAQSKVTNQNPNLAVAASAPAETAQYEITINSLARAQESRSALTGEATVVGDGKLEFAVGGNPIVTLDFNNPATTLGDVAAAVNNSGLGISASIDALSGELVLVGQNGVASGFTVNVVSGGAAGDAFDNNSFGFTNTQSAQDADASVTKKVAGQADVTQAFTGASNTFANALGLNLTLRQTTAGTPAIVDVVKVNPSDAGYVEPPLTTSQQEVKDGTALKKAINAFVDSYNSLAGKLRTQQKKGETLDVETAPSRLEAGLRNALSATVDIGAEDVSKLSLGFSISKEGVLTFNAAADFDARVAAGDKAYFFKAFAGTADAMAGTTDGLGTRLLTYITDINSQGGALKGRTDSIQRTIERLQRDRDSMEDRLIRLEKRYKAQFSSLDKVLSQLQSSASFLGQQLAGL